MKELSIEEIKSISLDILCEIDSICRNNNIKYSLAYGTLLGAVRHKGFIPWDDDIDIMMPRADYIKFVEYCKNNKTDFMLACAETDASYGYIFAKACDINKTTVITDNAKWQKGGIQIDIFPIDKLGNDLNEAKTNFNKTSFQRELLVAWNWKRYKTAHKSKIREFFKFIFYFMSRFVSNKMLIDSIKKYYLSNIHNECNYVGIICGAYRKKEIMDKSIYENYIELPFETSVFMAIEKYDEYLKTIYGDYMKLPPEEKRTTHHNFKAYWKQER